MVCVQLKYFVCDQVSVFCNFFSGFEWFSEEMELNLFSATSRQLFVHTNKLDSILNKLTAFALDRIVNLKSSGISSAKKTLARKIVTCIYKTASEKMLVIDLWNRCNFLLSDI